MNLWIRSQDKKRLIECHALGMQEKLQGQYAIIIADRHIIGTYKNKKRAIEVLDEIQKILTPQLLLYEREPVKIENVIEGNISSLIKNITIDRNYSVLTCAESVVYEMPKE